MISSSDELKDEYEKCMEAKNAAEENTIFAYQKKKGLAAERKIVREQKEEAERFKQKRKELTRVKQHNYLWQLFHVEEEATGRKRAMDDAQAQLDEILGDNKVVFCLCVVSDATLVDDFGCVQGQEEAACVAAQGVPAA